MARCHSKQFCHCAWTRSPCRERHSQEEGRKAGINGSDCPKTKPDATQSVENARYSPSLDAIVTFANVLKVKPTELLRGIP